MLRSLISVRRLGLVIAFGLSACGGGGSGGGNTVPPGAVVVSGTITYDRIPHDTFDNSLDYGGIQSRPIRGVVIEALDSSGSVLEATTSSATGGYALSLASNTDVRIRVKAQLFQSGAPGWDFSVTDNTNNHALYVMDGSLLSTGSSDSVRDLHAPHGWTGLGYGNPRVAAPFAIVDSVYEAVQLILSADPQATFLPAEIRWSVNNRPVENNEDRSAGELPTSFYDPSEGNIYLLGAENIDTDEYDGHLIIHEWGHYFEDQFSRADSIGGSHGLGERLDIRVAFGEGWGNALSAMATQDPVYRDALGPQQSMGGAFSVENNTIANPGWFSESSVHSILYDIFDSVDDGADTLNLGFAPIYEVLTSNNYLNQDSFTSIFSFAGELLAQQNSSATEINALLSAQQISSSDAFAAGETNGPAIALPVYHTVVPNGAAATVCSDRPNGEYNKVENRRYLQVDIPVSGPYTFRVVRQSGLTMSDPDIFVFRAGIIQGVADSTTTNIETGIFSLQQGVHIFEVFEFANVDRNDTTGGAVCFDVSVFN